MEVRVSGFCSQNLGTLLSKCTLRLHSAPPLNLAAEAALLPHFREESVRETSRKGQVRGVRDRCAYISVRRLV